MLIEKPTLERLKDKAFRDAFLERSVRESIAAQVKALRHQHGLSMEAFAERAGIHYSTVVRLENPHTTSPNVIVGTLLKIASAFDVALMIKFVAWSRFLQETFIILPTGTLEYFTQEIQPSEDALRLMEWALEQPSA